MSLASDLLVVANKVAQHESLIEKAGAPLVSLIAEAIEGGVSRESLVAAIKAEMTAASDIAMRRELGG